MVFTCGDRERDGTVGEGLEAVAGVDQEAAIARGVQCDLLGGALCRRGVDCYGLFFAVDGGAVVDLFLAHQAWGGGVAGFKGVGACAGF